MNPLPLHSTVQERLYNQLKKLQAEIDTLSEEIKSLENHYCSLKQNQQIDAPLYIPGTETVVEVPIRIYKELISKQIEAKTVNIEATNALMVHVVHTLLSERA